MSLKYKEFYRRNLPHYQPEDSIFAITFCLAFNIPKEVLLDLKDEKRLYELEHENEKKTKFYKKYFEEFDAFLAKYEHPLKVGIEGDIASIIVKSLKFNDGVRYRLIAYCLMPNHVHLILIPLKDEDGNIFSIAKIMHSLKSFTSNECNRLLGLKGRFWHHESYDHQIRNDKDYTYQLNYLLQNPVTAGLVGNAQDWKNAWINESLNQ
ncbi:MAG: transposase [Candidatus Zophobacter franzmannii]|nr:transposase [Candidatus Zophobacter franzmannii]